MKLIKFRVRNFRSVRDSGDVAVSLRTTLVGGNESGKTNLLRALLSLNPPGGIQALSTQDYPRELALPEPTAETPVLDTTWELSLGEQDALARIHPRARGVTRVMVSRGYGAVRRVALVGPTSVASAAEAEDGAHAEAEAWIVSRLPVFLMAEPERDVAELADVGKDAVLLLDEPGLALSPHARFELLRRFTSEVDHQVLIATHAPILASSDELFVMRVVDGGLDAGTVVRSG